MVYAINDWPLETPNQWADLYRKLTDCEKDQTFGGDVWRAINAVLSRQGVQEACIAKGYIDPFCGGSEPIE